MPVVKKVGRSSVKRASASKIVPVGEYDGGLINMVVYGRSGTGKTTFVATWPKPMLIIATQATSGVRSIRNVPDVFVRRVSSGEDFGEAVADAVDGPQRFETIAIDDASGLQDLCLRDVLGLEDIPVQQSWGLATQQDWGTVALKTKEYLRLVIGTERHTAIIAQEREFNVDNESEVIMPYVAAALAPSVVGWLNPACDYVVETFIRQRMEEKTVNTKNGKAVKLSKKVEGKVDFCMRVGPDPVYTTKFRTPKGKELPYVIVDPTYDKLVEYMVGKSEPTKPKRKVAKRRV